MLKHRQVKPGEDAPLENRNSRPLSQTIERGNHRAGSLPMRPYFSVSAFRFQLFTVSAFPLFPSIALSCPESWRERRRKRRHKDARCLGFGTELSNEVFRECPSAVNPVNPVKWPVLLFHGCFMQEFRTIFSLLSSVNCC
jgi:hypothetical protein